MLICGLKDAGCASITPREQRKMPKPPMQTMDSSSNNCCTDVKTMGMRICTYNAQGLLSGTSWDYLNDLMQTNDVLLVQETWLQFSQGHLFTDNMQGIDFVAVSAMDDTDLLHRGRPHGGCAIVWKSSLCCSVVSVQCNNNRVCAVSIALPNHLTCLLCCIYMPCDTYHDQSNVDEFYNVLSEVDHLIVSRNPEYVMCAGDFNTDFRRQASLHTTALRNFLHEEELCVLHDFDFYDVPFTFESKANGARSILDHVFISPNLLERVKEVYTSFSINNGSDHYPLHVSFEMDTGPRLSPRSKPVKQLWAKATPACIAQYAQGLENVLTELEIPQSAFECDDYFCCSAEHVESIQRYHNALIECCIEASSCVPKSTSLSYVVPGWNQFVKPYKEKALFWHGLWVVNGRPQYGVVADVRRHTRAQYHKAIKRAKAMESSLRFFNMANRFESGQMKEFWSEVMRMKGRGSDVPSNVGGAVGDAEGAELFRNKYSTLYNSVRSDAESMRSAKDEVDSRIGAHGHSCTSHVTTPNDVADAVRKLKRNKRDGSRGLCTDHLKNAPHSLFVHLSHLFNVFLNHGLVPEEFELSTLVPIPKSKMKSKNDIENYRSIALSSVINKVLDKILIRKCKNGFRTSDYQFGFKEQHSTAQCSFVVNEVVQHFVSNGSTVYAGLLDATKAFDRIAYCSLFQLLLDKSLCPVVIRFLYHLYMSQRAVVRWGNETSSCFSVRNGVKQGGVLSPVLFTLYFDQLLSRLAESRTGCHLGSCFAGAFAYADDVILLSPSLSGLEDMLNVCESYACEYQLQFNASKSKLVVINGAAIPRTVSFMGGEIEEVAAERHLGFKFGTVQQSQIVESLCTEMTQKTNMLRAHFARVPHRTAYALFKAYCMPLYGAQLLDFNDSSMQRLFVTWRKCIRALLALPPRTHSNLLPLICDDIPIDLQIYRRFMKFTHSLSVSQNRLVSRCLALALGGSRSRTSNSISLISQICSVRRSDVSNAELPNHQDNSDDDFRKSKFICELLDERWFLHMYHNGFLEMPELNEIITIVCTE